MYWPSVTIVMAIYKPNVEWLKKQLISINNQEYEGTLDLLIWNDSPNDFNCDALLKKYITKFPYKVLDNGKNNGVTTAFENLTKNAQGDYIEYADQDDIWIDRKTKVLIENILSNPGVVCSHCNFSLIDGDDHIIREYGFSCKITDLNNYDFQRRKTLIKSSLLGCAIMVKGDIARNSLPFPKMIFHDVWLALNCINKGRIIFIERVLLLHRLHGGNASQPLVGISCKDDYYKLKILKDYRFVNTAVKRLGWEKRAKKELTWVAVRKEYSNKATFLNGVKMVKLIKIRPLLTLFELALPFVPDAIFGNILKYVRFVAKKDIR